MILLVLLVTLVLTSSAHARFAGVAPGETGPNLTDALYGDYDEYLVPLIAVNRSPVTACADFTEPSGTYMSLDMTGYGEDYLYYTPNYDPDNETWYWEHSLPCIKKLSFNTVRLSFCFSDVHDRETHSVLDYFKLDSILTMLAMNGVRAILDLHNWEDMNGYFGSANWENNWLQVAQRYKGDTRIFAFELFNEPFPQCWNTCITNYDEVNFAYASLTDKIRAIDPNRKVVWLYTPQCWEAPQQIPLSSLRPNVVYTFHTWFFMASTIAEGEAVVQQYRTWIANAKQLGLQVWIGELGVDTSRNVDVQKYCVTQIINDCVMSGTGFIWWEYFIKNNHAVANAILTNSGYATY